MLINPSAKNINPSAPPPHPSIQPPLGPLIQVYEDFFVGLLDLSNAASGV